MTSNNSRIKIPIIPHGLRQEETIVQIATALDNITCVVNDVFQQIESNLQRHKEYLSNLKKRTETVASKIDQLVGKNVTTTVYSHYKFPVEEHPVDTIFKMNLRPLEKKIDVPIESKFQHAKYNKAPNKLQFFHINSSVDATKNVSTSLELGLGNLPPETNNIDSLFLFNTPQNIYEKYVMVDPLSITDFKTVTEETEKTDIAAAPNSIVNNEIYRNENYFTGFYTPAFEVVPSINVPLDLPDLPGIAGDLKFNAVSETSTPLAKQPQDTIKSKPIDEITSADLPIISKPIKQSVSSQDILITDIVKNVTNPELPPSSNSEPSLIQRPISSSIPPPPPPMPIDDIVISIPANVTAEQNTQNSNRVKAPSDNVHATLMEAIRKAGGTNKAQLRQVSQLEDLPTTNSEETDGGLFMKDLYDAIARRRKGISGKNKDDKNIGIKDRLSALIPQNSDESDESSGEDDENTWDE